MQSSVVKSHSMYTNQHQRNTKQYSTVQYKNTNWRD